MGKKRKSVEVNSERKGSDGAAGDTPKKVRKEWEGSEGRAEKGRREEADGNRGGAYGKKEAPKPGARLQSSEVFTDSSSSSSDSESEQNSKKNNSNSNSNSESDSDSSSDSSNTSKEETKSKEGGAEVVPNNNSVVARPVQSYPSCQRSSSSDSYHSDTEEEDKKRRKKQKKLLQMQLTKKTKRSNLPRTTEVKQEVQSDEEGPDSMPCNNDVNDLPAWPESDYAELIKRMEAQLPPKDNQKFDSRASKLDWSKIAFSKYSPEECMEVWLGISKRIRRYRILSEILQDARDWVRRPWTNFYRGSKKNRHPDMPPRPLSTYMIYYLEHKDKVAKQNPGMDMTQVSKLISETYKDLSPEERDRYTELAAKERKTFEAKLSDFYKEHPELEQNQKKNPAKETSTKGPRKAYSPFKLFLEQLLKKRSNVDRKTVEEEAREKWKTLNEKKKLVFINWALEDMKRYSEELSSYVIEHPDYNPPPLKSVLNKEEKLIKEKLAGKPIKPPNSAYSLFSRIMLQGDPGVKSIPPKQRMAEISRKWKQIPDSQKFKYEKEVRQLQDSYKLEFASYLEGLPEQDRILELQNQSKKSSSRKKASKSELRARSSSGNKKSRKSKEDEEDSWELYKGEPKPPPVNAFDVFMQSFQSQRGRTGKAKTREAQKEWDRMSDSKKHEYEKQLDAIKQKYIKDFELFLKGLSKPQLKEFSQMKEFNKHSEPETSGLLNGKKEDSNEDSDEDEGSSSESDSDASDSGKSSKSSSSSGDSDSSNVPFS